MGCRPLNAPLGVNAIWEPMFSQNMGELTPVPVRVLKARTAAASGVSSLTKETLVEVAFEDPLAGPAWPGTLGK